MSSQAKTRRDWGDYRKLFTQLPPAFERLPFSARALAAELGRRCDRKGRIIPVDGDGSDGCASHVDDLMLHVRAHSGDRGFIEEGVRALLEDTFLVVANGWLTIRNFEDAQESDSAKRMRAKRAAAEASDACDAHPSPASPGMVGLVGLVGLCSDQEGVQVEGTAGTPGRLDGIRDDDAATVCPLNLADRWTGADELSGTLEVSRAAVDAVVKEFVAYWTIGAGSGRKRSHWARVLRQRVVEQAPLEERKLAGGSARSSPAAGRALAVARRMKVEP